MTGTQRQLHLVLFITPGGHHEAAWRHHRSAPDRVMDIAYYQDLARRAEAAAFDAVFLADSPALGNHIRYSTRFRLEPFTWLSALAVATERIGLIGTASAIYTEPYNLARLFASLDHVSRGRAGWNIVATSAAEAAQNFGVTKGADHGERYRRAREFVEVVGKLWDSWESGALVADTASGLFADTDRIHRIDHSGTYLSVRGPLNVPRSPQGRPVYVQAGSSQDGRAFAAEYAEAIFCAHHARGDAQEFYADVKNRARALGRDPERIKVLPGVCPFVGSTEAEARALREEFDDLIQPAFSLMQLQRLVGVDLSGHDLDEPFPRELLPTDGEQAANSWVPLVAGTVDRERPTIRQLLRKLATGWANWTVTGTPEQVADELEEWFTHRAADGFMVMPPYFTGGLDAFAEQVVPVLRARGLFRREYTGATLRDHLGLSPASEEGPSAAPVPSPASAPRAEPAGTTL